MTINSDVSAVDVIELNRRMIDQAKARGCITTDAVEAAFRAVLRHPFLPGVPAEKVYSGEAIITRYDSERRPLSSSSEVCVMATMAEQLELERGLRVLEIGAGSGYNAALLACLVGESGEVTSVELDPEIAAEARKSLESAGFPHVRVVVGDGWLGYPDAAPYGRIELTASVTDLSPFWLDQLVDGGLLLVPLEFRSGAQAVVAFRKEHGVLRGASVKGGGFMPLRGPEADNGKIVALNGWFTRDRAMSGERLATIRELMRLKPRVEVLDELSLQTLSLIAILEPEAVSLWHPDPPSWVVGVLSPATRSLVLLEPTRGILAGSVTLLLEYGAEHAAAVLRAHVLELTRMSLSDLSIDAAPTNFRIGPTSGIVTQRANFRFTVRAAA